MKCAGCIRAAVIVCFAVYPFLVFFGIQYFPPGAFAVLIAVLVALRYGILIPEERTVLLPVLALLFGFSLATFILQSQTMLLWYPVLINFCLLVLFANSLRGDTPLLLRLVRARGIELSAFGPSYLRTLTGVWAVFFLINGMVAWWTTTRSLETWTFYNGLLSYLLITILMGGEYLFRRIYKKRKGVA